MLGEAMLVAAKDLRIEARARVGLAQILPFGAIVLLLFAFALDLNRGLLPEVAPGLFWIAVLLASILAVSRSFAVESEHNARDNLRLLGIDGAAIFLGKAAAIVVELLALEAVLLMGTFVFYDVSARGMVAIIPAAVAATCGIAATGTVYGILAAGLRMRETLVPLLVLPITAPVMLGATRAFEEALGGNTSQAWPWVQLLVVFAAIYVIAGVLAFGPLLEES
ncbi:MAG TPA: heme exporter protein CcmB [Acidimicrobiia bacterium]